MLKKLTEKLIACILSLSIICNIMSPFVVLAVGHNVTLDFSDGIVNGNEVTYQLGEETVKVKVKDDFNITAEKTLTVDEDEIATLFEFTSFNPNTMNIKFYAADGFTVYYNLQQDGTIVRDGEGGLPDSFKLKIESKTQNPPINDDNDDQEDDFAGSVFFTWNCANKVCIAEIDNLIPGGREGYPMNYIKESEVVDFVTGEDIVLDISTLSNDDYYWLWDTAQLVIQEEEVVESWDSFKTYFEKEENKREFAIDPCGSINGQNTITTNGDRVFRATIYSENKFESIAFSSNSSDYTYFPNFWDPIFYSSTVDISGTTKENPAKYEAYLLEKTIKFESGINSKYEIDSVKALVENEKAVTVKKVNGIFEVTFNSNYYDKVTLELTDVQGNKYYVDVCRTVMQAYDDFGPGSTEGNITAEIYYPSTYSYTDFEVYATINYNDGTSETILAENVDLFDIFDDSLLGKETEGGNGLKKAGFSVKVDDKDVKSVSFNAIYKNSDKDLYKGTFAGSGKGVTYDLKERGIMYE